MSRKLNACQKLAALAREKEGFAKRVPGRPGGFLHEALIAQGQWCAAS